MNATRIQKLAAKAIKKLRSSEPISDEELECAIQELLYTIPFIDALGERYALLRHSLRSDLSQFEDFRAARQFEDFRAARQIE